MSEVSDTINRLIDVAERTFCYRQIGAPSDVDELAAAVAGLQPPVGVMLSGAAEILMLTLASLWACAEARRPLWMTAVAPLLELTRGDLRAILEARQRPLEPDATYRTGGGMPRDDRRSYQGR